LISWGVFLAPLGLLLFNPSNAFKAILIWDYGTTAWEMSNVVGFEVVLANGTIVNASNTTNTDLFNFLKSRGNNFHIVSIYTLQVHPIGRVYYNLICSITQGLHIQVWARNLVFSSAQTDQILAEDDVVITGQISNYHRDVSAPPFHFKA
jgi:FAD/FMN-containing dehydrogenase